MKKFRFRLAAVLRVRAHAETEAKNEFAAAAKATLEGERAVERIQSRRREALSQAKQSLSDLRALDQLLHALDLQEVEAKSALSILLQEEEAAHQRWLHARKELQSLERLRERDLEAYRLEYDRRAQRELDEWAVLRCSA
ncbi:MAG: flagellar export protein FliJ [Fimbriimonadaceae bacterium]|nr:flagellar export protein FliJ [Fimbriimonadaceae bacterium]NUM39816.1 flagellar export protein FliJ [Armatimonadota bacterium]HQU18918.1 flagellar export protein FliJ [Fimbriimonadaceae bacterium]